ncbi:MAG: exodeoxyribonuclease VII small subunit [Candidatus Electryonea clarkiae]|nr:exodeoxyribonuclease VII small subunit [Candidatus Electryonea clarkiae]MDP8288369.1 exodeoxyribonuclease VII small subunit [Candidatus Electryonea clarkiae]
MNDEKSSGFEKDLANLETIVDRLEDGGLNLEESLKLFEEGQGLLKRCRDKLDKAQVRVRGLLESGETEPFELE